MAFRSRSSMCLEGVQQLLGTREVSRVVFLDAWMHGVVVWRRGVQNLPAGLLLNVSMALAPTATRREVNRARKFLT